MSKVHNNESIDNYIRKGVKNLITDVPGVRVGHFTYRDDSNITGVTGVIPSEGNLFKNKLVASAHVINGFGKSMGILQVQELGTLETPILLTNTFGIGTGFNAIVKYMLENNHDIGDTTGTVNPIVCECNDGKINNIRSMVLSEDHMLKSLENAGDEFYQGDIGAGAGMVCYGLKGGIGSASRSLMIEDTEYVLGILVLSNFGSIEDLLYFGKPIGKDILKRIGTDNEPDKGSIIIVLATDLPLDSSQLTRVLKRTQSGIARTGAYSGNGSGEIAIGFSTANRIDHYPADHIINRNVLHEDYIDMVFLATVQATEEAIINSMINANPAVERNGRKVYSLMEFKDILE